MFKKMIPFLVLVLAVVAVASAFAQTEDEIIARYIKKAEKQQEKSYRTYFATISGSYGKLSDNTDYNRFHTYANGNINPGGPVEGIWRSKQFAANIGTMATKSLAVNVGFAYWLKMGGEAVGDFDFQISPLGTQEDFNLVSEISVYGIAGGVDYYLMNPPNEEGLIKSLGIRLGGSVGYYWTKWELWEGMSSINLSTGFEESNIEPLKGSTPGFSGWVGFDYPTGLWGLVVGLEAEYLYLNFSTVKSYNSLGEELYATYSENPDDRVELDFSGPRGKFQIKRFFRW
nr:hypothetical protein [candidate division Zixibacteria bacterium]